MKTIGFATSLTTSEDRTAPSGIGLHDARIPDRYEWISGENSDFRAWGNNQPDNFFGDQQYVIISQGGFLRPDGWDDVTDGAGGGFFLPRHGVVEVNYFDPPLVRDPAFAYSNFDEPGLGAGNFTPGFFANELGFTTEVFSAEGNEPSVGAIEVDTTPRQPRFSIIAPKTCGRLSMKSACWSGSMSP